MHSLEPRWFDSREIAAHVHHLAMQCAQAPASEILDTAGQRQQTRVKATIAATLLAALAMAALIGAMVAFAEPLPGREPNYPAVAMLCLLIVGGSGGLTYAFCGRNNQLRVQRDGTIQKLCAEHSLRASGRLELEGSIVGSLPWFISEELSHLFGLACGHFQGSDLCLVEYDQVIDPVLTATDSKLLQGASQFVSKKQQRLHKKDLEAVVFIHPLTHVPDMIIVPKKDPNRAYYKRALTDPAFVVNKQHGLPHKLLSKYWAASADPDACAQFVNSQLQDMLTARPWCMVQVVGGYCVVATAAWHGNQPAQAPHSEADILANLEFANNIYQGLAAVAPSLNEPYDPSPQQYDDSAAGGAAVATMADAPARTSSSTVDAPAALTTTAATKTRKVRKRQRHSIGMLLLLIGLGLPLGLAALGLSCFATNDLKYGRVVHTWPQTDAVISDFYFDAGADENGQEQEPYFAKIAYDYHVDGQLKHGDRIGFGMRDSTKDRAERDALKKKYAPGTTIKVFYSPAQPNLAAIEPGVANESVLTGTQYVCGALSALGFAMFGYGVIGKRRRTSSSNDTEQ